MKKPCLNKHLEYFVKKNNKVIIFNKISKKSYILEYEIYNILTNIDGARTLKEIADESNITFDEMSTLINIFNNNGFIEQDTKERKFDIFKIKIGLFAPDKLLNNKRDIVNLFRFIIIYFSIPIFLLGLLGMWNRLFIQQNNLLEVFSNNILFVVLSYLASILLHELSHAIVAKYFDANVAEVGIMLYCFIPCVYASICGMSFVQHRIKRIQLAFAGSLMNMQLAGIGLILYKISLSEKCYLFFIINLMLIIINSLIFIRFDGYYVLQELLGVSDLLGKSRAYLLNLALGNKFSKYRVNTSTYSFIDKLIFIFFGMNSFLLIVILLFMSIYQIVTF